MMTKILGKLKPGHMTLFLLLLPWLVSALESNELSYQDPSSCSPNQTYSPLTLTCQTCPPG